MKAVGINLNPKIKKILYIYVCIDLYYKGKYTFIALFIIIIDRIYK